MFSTASRRRTVVLGAIVMMTIVFGATARARATTLAPVHVRIVDLAFVPAVVHLKVGQKIVWTNEDQVAHTVTSGMMSDENLWPSSPPLGEGKTFELLLHKPGTYAYFCKPHFYNAAMHARIIVDR